MSPRLTRPISGALTLVAASALLWLPGCARPQPPSELLAARAALWESSQSARAALTDGELEGARTALRDAEWSFISRPTSQRARDLAYVARRTAQRAEALGNRATAEAVREHARRTYQLTGPFETRRGYLAVIGREDGMDEERQARALTTHQAQLAMANLARVEGATREARGLVINLPGLLFESEGTSLLGDAEYELRLLAGDLRATGRSILVEGHTDSTGSPSFNKDLSRRRAAAVRDYLVSLGAPIDSIRSMGLGAERPVGDNATPDGRAKNRRVEIVIEKE